jgi:hypothetical protein
MFKPTITALAVACALAAACSGPSPVAPGESTLGGGPESAAVTKRLLVRPLA